MRKFLHALTLATVAVLALPVAHAQNWPTRPVRLIVPYAVGQGTDIAARFIAEELGKELKQPVVVENRPGAGGNIGTASVARATPDGHTILIGTNATHAANAFLYASPGYDAQADFEPVGMMGILPLVYIAHPSSPVNSMQDLVRAAKARPDALNVAISTTTSRMAHELFKSRAGTQMFPVDFKGSAQAVTAVIGGQVEYMVDTIASLRTAIVGKQVKALGVTSLRSSRLLPGVTSLAEQGITGYELIGWTVFYAPKGTPPEALRVLSAAIDKTVGRPEIQDKLMQLGIEPQTKSREELKAFGDAEKDKWERLIKAAGIKPGT